MPERFEWVRDRQRLAEIGPAWDDLAETDETPFASHSWFGPWLEAFATDESLRVLTGWNGDRLVSVLPLLRGGRGLVAAANWHTPVFRAAASGVEEAQAVYTYAVAQGALTVGVLREDDPGLEALLGAAEGTVLRDPGPVQPAVDVTAGVEEWRRSLSKNRTKDLRRRTRRMHEEHDSRIYALEAPADLQAELEAGLRTEAAGWKGQTGTAIVSRPDTDRFYRELAARLHQAGKLRFCGLEIDGSLAAFELMVVHGGRVFSIKGGYDERFSAFAPGLQVQVAAIERAFELGMRSYEFLGADESWKRSLGNADRPTVTVRSFPSTLRGRAEGAFWAHTVPAARRARARVRALRSRG
jgi:CelD/BcsL family acetyltransferase involved in cellulose biosynthesis